MAQSRSTAADPAAKIPKTDPLGRTLECDLIMKGGVTSGLVYPGAIYSLTETFRLRNIGGTSAGAIGATAAAAMEYGLRSGRNLHARDQMAWLNAQLADRTDQGMSRLDAMFCGDPGIDPGEPGTAPLLAAFKGAMNGNMAPALGLLPSLAAALPPESRRALRVTGVASLLQAVAGGALAWLLASAAHGGAGFEGMAAGLGAVGSLAAAGTLNLRASLRHGITISPAQVNRLLQPIVSNGLGLATGFAEPPATINQRQLPSLTLWLHQTIQSLAGHSDSDPHQVLTFGKLWSLGQDPDASAFGQRAIDLVLVCSDLNRLHSASFPFLPDNQRLFYDPQEWQRLFPAPVLEAMEPHSWQIQNDTMPPGLGYAARHVRRAAAEHDGLENRLRLMPKGRNIPILVAARASMAFPGLFTPLPLWLLRWVGKPEVQEERRPVLSRVYLSDGGITSNFPIHLFDSALPGRPTFALNLLYPDDDLSIEEFGQINAESSRGKAVPGNVRTLGGTTVARDTALTDYLIMPFADGDRVQFYKAPAAGTPLAQVGGLLARVVETARTWGDVNLYNQVGMRDRIIHIQLTGSEGGFNLGMDSAAIASLNSKGTAAGNVLACRFRLDQPVDPLDHPNQPRFTLTWQKHRQIRAEGFLIAQDLLATRFQASWQPRGADLPQALPPYIGMIDNGHSLWVAQQLAAIGAAAPPPAGDPLETALRPLNVLRMRPAEADPRASQRATGNPAWEPPPPATL